MPEQTPLERWEEAVEGKKVAERAVTDAQEDATRRCDLDQIRLTPVSCFIGPAILMQISKTSADVPGGGFVLLPSDARELAHALLELVGEEPPDADS